MLSKSLFFARNMVGTWSGHGRNMVFFWLQDLQRPGSSSLPVTHIIRVRADQRLGNGTTENAAIRLILIRTHSIASECMAHLVGLRDAGNTQESRPLGPSSKCIHRSAQICSPELANLPSQILETFFLTDEALSRHRQRLRYMHKLQYGRRDIRQDAVLAQAILYAIIYYQ